MNEYYVRMRGGLAGWHAFSAEASRLDRGATVQAGGRWRRRRPAAGGRSQR